MEKQNCQKYLAAYGWLNENACIIYYMPISSILVFNILVAVMNTKLFPEKSVSEECLWPLPHVCRWCGRCSRSLLWSQSHGTSASSLPSSWAPLHRVRTKRTSHHRHRPLLNTQRTSGLNSRLFWYCAKLKDYEWYTKHIDCGSNSTFLRAFWGRERLEDSVLLTSQRERLKDSVPFSSQRERLEDSVLFSSQQSTKSEML